jgi:DNA-binding MarR family transcriptional regulator
MRCLRWQCVRLITALSHLHNSALQRVASGGRVAVSPNDESGGKARRRAGSGSSRPLAVGILPNLIGYNVRRAQIALWRDFSRTVGRGEIRPAVFSLLILVEANPGIAQFELAEALDLDKTSIVGLLHRLQRRQWLTRKRSTEDRRRHGIFLTPRGQEMVDELRREMIEHEKRFTRLFTREELVQLFAFLRRIHP